MFSAMRRITVAQDVAQQIKEKVLSGELSSGDKLPTERDLALQLGVSRSTIREAVRALEQSGFVRVHKGPRGGIFIASADGKPLRDSLGLMLRLDRVPLAELLESRAELECSIARFAAQRATAEELDEMSTSIDEMNAGAPSLESFRRNNYRFHLAVAKASRNRVSLLLTEVLRDLVDQSLELLHVDDVVWSRVIEHHGKIFEAIRSREADAAEKAMRAHLALLEEDLVAHRAADLLVRPGL